MVLLHADPALLERFRVIRVRPRAYHARQDIILLPQDHLLAQNAAPMM